MSLRDRRRGGGGTCIRARPALAHGQPTWKGTSTSLDGTTDWQTDFTELAHLCQTLEVACYCDQVISFGLFPHLSVEYQQSSSVRFRYSCKVVLAYIVYTKLFTCSLLTKVYTSQKQLVVFLKYSG